MLWIETKYASMINNKVRNYNRVGPNLWNFSCIYCGDSSKNKRKARGYIYLGKKSLQFHCHNCGINKLFKYFLKDLDEGLYQEMLMEMLNENKSKQPDKYIFKKPVYVTTSGLSKLPKASSLKPNHPCKLYITSRKIPSKLHHELFYCHKFKNWTNEEMIPNKFSNLNKDDSRLIIPFLDKSNKLFGYQGRSLNPNDDLRYITIMLDENQARLYGQNRCNVNNRYYAVEGPIDSMFIDNCLASAGSDIVSELEKAFLNKENAVIIYDNEPRNKETVKKIAKAIRKGYQVVIWPDELTERDVNQMVLNDLPIMQFINNNIYKGLDAELRLASWKRVT